MDKVIQCLILSDVLCSVCYKAQDMSNRYHGFLGLKIVSVDNIYTIFFNVKVVSSETVYPVILH